MNDLLPVSFSLFPGGRHRALTLSFDDGGKDDRRLVEIFNRYKLRGTFHLNSYSLGKDDYIKREEVASLYQGHEVSAHSVTHPFPTALPLTAFLDEMWEDRKALEKLCGYPVRGMSYPFGIWNQEIAGMLPSLGLRYSRICETTNALEMPDDFFAWKPTMHHKDGIVDMAQKLIEIGRWRPRLGLFYVWGHSFEFSRDDNWELMEQFGEKIGGHSEIWYATNIEIADYCAALKRLEFSADFMTVLNPTALDLWIAAGKTPVKLTPGSRTNLKTGESVPFEFWKA